MKKIYVVILLLINNISIEAWVLYYWERVYYEPATTNNIFCDLPIGIKCIDSNDCIVVSSCNSTYIKVLKSIDQGYTWSVLYANTINKFGPHYAIAYPAKNYIYCGGDYGSILRSTDGFKTYDTTMLVYFALDPSSPIVRNLFMGDSINGIANTDARFFITNDGWKSYKWIPSPWHYSL